MNGLLRKLGLRFDSDADERAFLAQFAARYLGFSRFALALGGALLLSFILWDRIIDAEGARTTMWIRIGIMSPVCFLAAALLQWRAAQAWFEPLIVVAGGITAMCISAICAILAGGYNFVAAGLLLIVTFVYSLFRLRTPAFLAFALLTFAGYFAGLAFAHGYAPGMPGMNLLMVGTCLFVGLVAVVSRELSARDEFRGGQALAASHARVEELLHSMLPAPIVKRIQAGETLIADQHHEVSIVFSDLVGFTELSRRVSAARLVEILNRLFSAFDRAAEAHGMHKIKTIGDAYMAVGGLVHLPGAPPPADSAAELAFAMLRRTAQLAAELGVPLDVRVGLHVGPVVAGVIGTSRPAFDCWGESVNLASRLEASAAPGAVMISEHAWRLLRGRFDTEVRDGVQLKGLGATRVYLLHPPAGGTRLPSMWKLPGQPTLQ